MKVLIFGLGLNQGGVGSALFFAKQGTDVRVTDLKDAKALKPSLDQLKAYPQITYTLGRHKKGDIDWADLIIKNPAVKPGNPFIGYALKQGKQVEMDMGIFLEYVDPSQIIGVTGTKGKSTTASLIYEILMKSRHDSEDVILTGNIGRSALDVIPHIKPNTLIILEISSFQLETFATHKVSPKWAVVTNITPDHLNYYQAMDEYIEAKRIIGKHQTQDDYLFLRKNDPVTSKNNFLKGFEGQIIFFSKDDLPKDFKPHLMGEHNLENMAAALAVARAFGIPKDSALSTLVKFKGVPLRMELIKTWGGVKIYNDTTATSPEAGIQAINTWGGNLQTHLGCLILICGGMNKGMDYTKYATIVGKLVKKVFFLEGDSTEEIRKQLSAISHQQADKIMGTYNNLEKLLIDVEKIVESGDTILFSPAATSFNLFQNEFDRGRKFNQAVEKIFHD